MTLADIVAAGAAGAARARLASRSAAGPIHGGPGAHGVG
jgi:hypothetical protein